MFKIHLRCNVDQNTILLCCWILFRYVDAPPFVCPSFSCWRMVLWETLVWTCVYRLVWTCLDSPGYTSRSAVIAFSILTLTNSEMKCLYVLIHIFSSLMNHLFIYMVDFFGWFVKLWLPHMIVIFTISFLINNFHLNSTKVTHKNLQLLWWDHQQYQSPLLLIRHAFNSFSFLLYLIPYFQTKCLCCHSFFSWQFSFMCSMLNSSLTFFIPLSTLLPTFPLLSAY